MDANEPDEHARALNYHADADTSGAKKYGYHTSVSAELLEGFSVLNEAMHRWHTQEINRIKFGEEGAQRGHIEVEQPDPKRIEAFEEFEKRWDALVAEGEEAGFLGYEEGGWYASRPREIHRFVEEETDAEYDARIAELKRYRIDGHSG